MRSPAGAVRRALDQVGEEVSGLLQRAHDSAASITGSAQTEAEELVETARREADEITATAHERLRDLDTDTEAIWAERDRIVGDARELARQLLDLAEAATERFPPADESDNEPTAVIRIDDMGDDETLGFATESD